MLLSTYKEQSGTEKGFKFIKDNSFEIDSVFLKETRKNRCFIDDYDAMFDGV